MIAEESDGPKNRGAVHFQRRMSLSDDSDAEEGQEDYSGNSDDAAAAAADPSGIPASVQWNSPVAVTTLRDITLRVDPS